MGTYGTDNLLVPAGWTEWSDLSFLEGDDVGNVFAALEGLEDNGEKNLQEKGISRNMLEAILFIQDIT